MVQGDYQLINGQRGLLSITMVATFTKLWKNQWGQRQCNTISEATVHSTNLQLLKIGTSKLHFSTTDARFYLRLIFYLSTYNKQNNPDLLHRCKIEIGLYTGWDHTEGDGPKKPKTSRMENGTASVHTCGSRTEDNKHNQYSCSREQKLT